MKNTTKDSSPKNENDLGFGTRNYSTNNRFLNRDGSVNIIRRGRRLSDSVDIYHTLITMPWTKFLWIVIAGYILVNIFFATLYYAIGYQDFGNLHHVSPAGDFMDLFFFSAQTITTVGYGYVYPKSVSASTIAAIESMLGLLGFALATGVLYGRFSRPKADILYSRHMLVSPYKEMTGLMFRIANSKQNELIEIEAQVVLAMTNTETKNRMFLSLPLERQKINFLPLNWTIVHPIDENSPVYGFSHEDLVKGDVEVIILVKAINDTYSQTVYSRISYKFNEIVHGAKFKPMVSDTNHNGRVVIDLSQIHDYEMVELPEPAIVS
ncbi:MAG: ion channel [Bacteroidia bacterium]